MRDDNVLPAYIRLKFAKRCSICFEVIPVGELAFWFGKEKKAYHGKCGSDKWKVSGSPYSIRRSAAISHKLDPDSEVRPLPPLPIPKPIEINSDEPKYNRAKFNAQKPRWPMRCVYCNHRIDEAGYWFKNKEQWHHECFTGSERNVDSNFLKWLEEQANDLLKRR